MSNTTTQPVAASAVSTLNHINGQRSWNPGPLTITWYAETFLPIVNFVVKLDDKIIAIGGLTGASKLAPIEYSFYGSVQGDTKQIQASGTLILDHNKKEVTFNITIEQFVIQNFKGVLFNY